MLPLLSHLRQLPMRSHSLHLQRPTLLRLVRIIGTRRLLRMVLPGEAVGRRGSIRLSNMLL